MGPTPIPTQLLEKWVGPEPEKHIGSTPLSGVKVRLLRAGLMLGLGFMDRVSLELGSVMGVDVRNGDFREGDKCITSHRLLANV